MPEPPISDDEWAEIEAEAAAMPIDWSHETRMRAQSAYYATLNARLLAADRKTAMQYAKLRMRVARYLRLLTMHAPQTIVDDEVKLLTKSMDEIDPSWRDVP